MDKDLLSKTANERSFFLSEAGLIIAIVSKLKQPGFARPRFAVTTPGRKKEIIAIVDSRDEAFPAMCAYLVGASKRQCVFP